MSTHYQIVIFDWSDISYLSLPSAYKLMNLDSDDRQLLTETYKAMYPDKHIRADMVSVVCRKYSSVTLAGEKIGSRLECRSLRSARVMASWADQDGQVNPTAAIRPGFVKLSLRTLSDLKTISTRSMYLHVLNGTRRIHKGNFIVALLRSGTLRVSTHLDLQFLFLYRGCTASLLLLI